MSSGHAHPADLVDEILRLRAEGLSCSQIGDVVGMTKNAVVGVCRRAGICVPRPGSGEAIRAGLRGPAPEVVAKARKLWGRGHSRATIARKCGISEDALDRMRVREGWVLRKPRENKAAVTPDPLPLLPQAFARTSHTYADGRRCVFPIGEPRTPGFRWCDAVVTLPGSYCDAHRRLCYWRRPADVAA